MVSLLIIIPEAPLLPTLPPGAQINPDDGVAGLLRPTFGPQSADYQLCNRAMFKETYFFVNIAVLLSFSLLYFVAKDLPRNMFVLAIIATTDVLMPENLSHIMPLATLQRLIPGFFFVPIQFHLFSLLLARASCLIISKAGKLLLGLCLLIIVMLSPSSTVFLQNQKYPLSKYPTGSQAPTLRSYMYLKPLKETKKYPSTRNLFQVQCSMLTNCEVISDRKRSKRWYARGQIGREFVKLRLAHPEKISGVKMYQDEYLSDFPRKLHVIDCASNKTIVAPYEWLGSLYKSKSNNLYFAAQANKVNIIHFRFPVTSDCIEIKQVGYDPAHDWSITEIELFK